MNMKINKYADMVLSSNAIFTCTHEEPQCGAIAISGNRIMAVGLKDDIASLIGPDTKVYDYKDELIVPGFHDSHVHMILSSLLLDSVNLLDAKSEDEAARKVYEFSKQRPDDPWILGFSWYHVFWDKKVLPTRHSLDKYIPDRPVLLLDAEGHGAWINTKAMKVCGIDRNTKSPQYGEIFKDENGEPTGYLHDLAMGLGVCKAYDLPEARQIKLMKLFMKKAARMGITSIGDIQYLAGGQLGNADVYHKVEENDELTMRINFSIAISSNLDYAKHLRETYHSEKLMFSGLKMLVDGVPSAYTGLMVEPYSDKPDTCGIPFVPLDELREQIMNADKEKFRIRLHACGDGAVRYALNSYEEAQKLNGIRDSRHTIEHIEVIQPNDIGRIAKLGVVASMQPEHLAMTDKFSDNPYGSRVGKEREKYLWAIKTIMNTGAHMQFGSDFPVVDNNPMLEIYRGVTRVHNDGEPKGGWNPKEKLTVGEVIKGYTLGSAYGAFRENDLGTIEEGKLADITVLDQNLFTIDPEKIRDTKVRLTVMDGKVVYEG